MPGIEFGLIEDMACSKDVIRVQDVQAFLVQFVAEVFGRDDPPCAAQAGTHQIGSLCIGQTPQRQSCVLYNYRLNVNWADTGGA